MARAAKKKVAKSGLPEGESKLSTNIPETLHRKLKAVAALRGVSIRDLIIEYAQNLKLEVPPKRKRLR